MHDRDQKGFNVGGWVIRGMNGTVNGKAKFSFYFSGLSMAGTLDGGDSRSSRTTDQTDGSVTVLRSLFCGLLSCKGRHWPTDVFGCLGF